MDRYLVDQGLFPRSKKSTTKRKSHVVFLGNGKGKNPKPSKKAKKKAGPQGRATGAQEQAAGVRDQRGPLEIPLDVESAAFEAASQDPVQPVGQTWAERQESEARGWADVRPSLFDNLLSTHAVPQSG